MFIMIILVFYKDPLKILTYFSMFFWVDVSILEGADFSE